MKRSTIIILTCALFAFASCKQSAEKRYQRYLEEVADTSSIEFLTPEEDPAEYVEEEDVDPLASDKGLVTVPDIPQERHVNMRGSSSDVERMMMGKE